MIESYISEMDVELIAQYRSRYDKHPLRLLQIENFLPYAVAGKVSSLLKSQAEFEAIYGLHSVSKHIVKREEWLRSDEDDQFFHYEMLAGIKGSSLSKDALAFLKLRQFLSSDAFCEFVWQIAGRTFSTVTAPRVHRLRQNHYLKSHNDRNNSRKIAYILYLSPDWKSQYGGQLTLIGRDGDKQQVEPHFNNLVLFDVTHHKEHYIEAMTAQSHGWNRDTMSGWFIGET